MGPLLKRTSRYKSTQFRISTIFTILTILQISRCSYDLQEVEENDICPGDGFFPDPRSCTKFYRCVETYALFFAYEFECPQQTVFDPDLQVCNHPYAVRPDYRCHLDHFYHWKPRVKTKKIRATVTETPVVDKVIRDTVAEKPVVDKVPVSNQTQPDFIDLNITMQNSQ